MNQAYLVDGVRTPVGRHGGSLSTVRVDDLAGLVLSSLLKRNPSLDPAAVDDVVFGSANQAGEDNRNLARMALLLAGYPQSVPGITVNRLCASGLSALALAAAMISSEQADVVVAGGAENMTRAPLVMDKGEQAFARGNRTAWDTTLGWRFPNPKLEAMFPLESMAETGENVAEAFSVSRARQDAFALSSQQKWQQADQAGWFDPELVAVPLLAGRQPRLFDKDEHPRPATTLEGLAKLAPIARAGGTVTAGNASGINDGAAALLVVSAQALKRFALTPIARVVGSAQSGVDPRLMGLGPVPATRKLLDRLKLGVEAVDRVELNEAFASQSLVVIDQLGLDPQRVNVQGGAIAIGHPLGMSGARLVVTLLHQMRRDRFRRGLATLCVGVGQGVSLLIERED
ncbi:MAG: acetyl-CoA C-acyltransferase [Sulfobacillus sp.]